MLETGRLLHDRYKLKQKLGQNAGRQTWLAEDLSCEPHELVIVKLLAFADQIHWDNLKLFEREAQILKELNHPQIPKYRDYFSVDDRLLWFGLVQDYIPGNSLRERLAQGKRFTEAQIRQIAINLLYILSYLHELNPPVLHRDIKPSNLIWGDDQYIYLVDFGAVQDRVAAPGATFTVVGTYGYTPMEQFGGRAVPASDLYALGATLIHLLTGTPPADLPHIDLRIQFADRISINPQFVRWIEKLTEPDATKRFATAREALEALQFGQLLTISTPSDIEQDPWLAIAAEEQTSFSGIELSKTEDELLIQIPALRESYVFFLLILMGSIGTFLSLGFLPGFLLILVPAFTPFLVSHWYLISPTYVEFNQNEFVAYKKFSKWTLPVFNGKTGEIEDIFHTLKTFQSGRDSHEKRVIVIQTKAQEHYFGEDLSREECTWLTKEIKDWLNLS
jgi:serine/threonine protein kinase